MHEVQDVPSLEKSQEPFVTSQRTSFQKRVLWFMHFFKSKVREKWGLCLISSEFTDRPELQVSEGKDRFA